MIRCVVAPIVRLLFRFVPDHDLHLQRLAMDRWGELLERANVENQRLRSALLMIAHNEALSAETHRLIAQDVLGGFAERDHV